MMRSPILDVAFTETCHHAESYLYRMTFIIQRNGSHKGAFIAGSSAAFSFLTPPQ